MAEARRTRQIPGWEKKTKDAQAVRSLVKKTFEELTTQEKELLLKNVAIRLGLIAPSREEG